MRLVTFIRTNLLRDLTYNAITCLIWTIVEPSSYMIAGTLPSMGPLLNFISKDVRSKLSHSSRRSLYQSYTKDKTVSSMRLSKESNTAIVKQTTVDLEQAPRSPASGRPEGNISHAWHDSSEALELR